MALDCMIDQPCNVKDTLTSDGLIRLVKQRNRCLAIINLLKNQGRTDEQILNERFKTKIYTPSGIHIMEHSVAELLEATHPLEELQEQCKSCPANCGRVFGCYSSINYPISRKAEEWLAGVARMAGESKGPGLRPFQFITEQKVDGGRITGMRADTAGSFFELKKPLEIPVAALNGIFSRNNVNTDQLLNMFTWNGRLSCGLMRSMLFLAGAIHVQDNEPAVGPVKSLLVKESDGRILWYVFNISPEISDDDSTRMFKEYLRSMFVAFCIGREMLVNL